MKKECISMLLAGGQGSRLYALTEHNAKPALPFGGKYRIIDFALSNCANSGIDTVGVLTQYRPLKLNSYLGNGQPWDLDRSDGGVHVLPPTSPPVTRAPGIRGRPTPSIRTSGSSTCMTPSTSSSSPATTFIRWIMPKCWSTTRRLGQTLPSPCWRCPWMRPAGSAS